ncbi:hypothetical protein [Alteribacillus bidgolensis]|uniref:Uncharacterized protein n=1 Tax=Alteribacillus bidgolensis TaxID=930129 RepID=A0A1G8JHK2_9BACI|nr:hypothetical protein [Alteribacillus bidgolensis]SDI30497.1 hypothetical protein SAMN05216352_106196 [Alteribacillus bidgolensis]
MSMNHEELSLYEVTTMIIAECFDDNEIYNSVSNKFNLHNDDVFEIDDFIEKEFPEEYKQAKAEVESEINKN